MILRGAIVADASSPRAQRAATRWGPTRRRPGRDPAALTQIWGNHDVDTFQLGDRSGLAGGTTLGSDGYIFLGSKTQIYGTASAPACGPTSCSSAT